MLSGLIGGLILFAATRCEPSSVTPSAASQAGVQSVAAPAKASGGGLDFKQSLRLLVPAYFYPLPGSPWTRLNNVAALHPGLVTAVGNPFNGPGQTFDPNYAAAFAAFRANHGQLLGYVYTSYGQRPLADVKTDIDTWVSWYALDGFFFDEMDNVPGAHEVYYQALYAYARGKLPLCNVMANPGVGTSESYLVYNGAPVASSLCIIETGTAFTSWQSDAWIANYPRRDFCALAYGIGTSGWQAAVDHAYGEHCGWVFVTSGVLPNPWDQLPSYFEAMADFIAAQY